MRKRIANCSRVRGSALIEFVLCFGLFWTPLFLGILRVGFNLIQALQVTQVCRDAAHMHSQGVDLSQTAYKTLLVNLAPSLGLAATGGNGEIILSTITYVASTDCSGCTNTGKYVVTRRIIIGVTGTGNNGFPASNFGTPNASIWDSVTGNINSGSNNVPYYYTDASAQAGSFGATGISLKSGQYAFIAEMYVQSPYWTSLGTIGTSAVSFF